MHRSPAKSFEDLEVWQIAHQLTLSVYRFSANLPKSEKYGLISQIRRAAVSVSANIAEGFKKRGVRDKARFYNIAQGSLEECRYYLILIRDLGYGDPQELLSKVKSVQGLLGAYVGRLING
jgi:four helix bundle protein